MKSVITVIGEDKMGIIAGVSRILADNGVNILDISQTTMREMFTMMMFVDVGKDVVLPDLADKLNKLGEDMELTIRIQHQDLFEAMHKI